MRKVRPYAKVLAVPSRVSPLPALDGHDQVFGSGGRVGYICPSTCERFAREFYETAPADVALLISTLTISQINQEHVDRALAGIEQGARHLAATGADMIYAAGLPLLLRGGLTADRQLRESLERATGLPCMTDLTSILYACRQVNVERIVLASPFTDEINEQIASIFAEVGIHVLAHRGFGLDRQIAYQRLDLKAPEGLLKELFAKHPQAEGAFVACGRFGYVPDVTALEEMFGVPVLLANQVAIWWALDTLERATISSRGGHLLTGRPISVAT